MKLNIGNPAPFGFDAPESILVDMVRHLPTSQGYSDSRGIFEARTAVAGFYQAEGLTDVTVDDVFIGNGVSEMISMVMQALVDDGDEILVPAPDYPLWTASITLAGGAPCTTCATRATAGTPTCQTSSPGSPSGRGRWCSSTRTTRPGGVLRGHRQGVRRARPRHDLVLLADEIYEKILYDDAIHVHGPATPTTSSA